MSLRVWLPLNGDLKNNGLDNIEVVNNGATVDNNGKIGKCYYLSGNANSYINTNYSTNIGTSDFSISLWVKIPTITSGSYYTVCTSKSASAVSSGFGIYWNYSQKKFLWSTADGTNASEIWMASTVDSIVYDKWIHLVMVRNNSDAKKGYFYINGERYELTSIPAIRNITIDTKLLLGKCSNGSYPIKAYYNDFRIYDHVLSAKEVKELSKGLVCHYKLDSKYATNNLIINGFGESNNENWVNSNISTTEIPPNHSEIKASFYNGNMTKEYIPLNQNHSYTISGYIKSSGATSGTTYPSIYPYDIDKKFISNYNTIAGFSSTFKTTLAQPLKKGDTVIYATDLSAWTTATNNHYYYVAIFGYKDSTGYIYPDMIYTQDCPVFGSYSDKSNIDKTNNTVTLKSAYTGEDRPAGTTICQATAGGTYLYPWGGIALSSIQDWTFKTATFVPKNSNRLVACKYIRWSTYGNCYIAGNQLIDNDDNSIIVYDTSGYRYNGIPSENLTVSTSTPKYTLSTVFNDNTDNILITPCFSSGQTMSELSVSCWFKTNTLNSTNPNIFSLGENAFCRVRIPSSSSTSIWYYVKVGSTAGCSSTFNSGKSLIDNTWHQVIYVFKDGIVTIYLDGVQIGTTDHSSKGTSMTCSNVGTTWHLAGYTATNEKLIGNLSDFRIYTTALSADDVKELYQAGASIDKDGNVFAYEFKED